MEDDLLPLPSAATQISAISHVRVCVLFVSLPVLEFVAVKNQQENSSPCFIQRKHKAARLFPILFTWAFLVTLFHPTFILLRSLKPLPPLPGDQPLLSPPTTERGQCGSLATQLIIAHAGLTEGMALWSMAQSSQPAVKASLSMDRRD